MNFRVMDASTGPNKTVPNPKCCGEPTTLCPRCALAVLSATAPARAGRLPVFNAMVPNPDGSDMDEFSPMPRLDFKAMASAGRGGSNPPAASNRPAQADDDDEAAPMPRLDYKAIVAGRDRFR